MQSAYFKKKVELLTKALAGSWRREPPEMKLSAGEMEEIAPLVLGSGVAALIWRRIRNTDLYNFPAASSFLEGHRFYAIQNAVIENKIEEVFCAFRSEGIEPIVIKGWAIARLYPEKGLRLYGDIDLVVRPEDYPNALDLVTSLQFPVDLHRGLSKLDAHRLEELYTRSQLVKLGEADVRVLGAEDHLRLLCTHFLRDGAWLPRGLCDISLAVENLTDDFDWDICLGKDRRRANWVACAIGLAHHLLDAGVDNAPARVRAVKLPRWLVPAVLKQWETPNVRDHHPQEFMISSLLHPARIPKAILGRWPDPIKATVMMNGQFNDLPRLPYQTALFLWRASAFVKQIAKMALNPAKAEKPA